MYESLIILGRQPKLSLAELETLFGADSLKPSDKNYTLLKENVNKVEFNRLGGSIKLCKILTKVDSSDWNIISEKLLKYIPDQIINIPEGKIKFGISVYGLKISPKAINATGLAIKKACKQKNRSMRVIPNKGLELNSAQILNNKMTDELGMELVLAVYGEQTIIAQTTAVQDIDAYAARDQKRPARDARVGMLPPKLAQIIINLSGAKTGDIVLDPFCGTGVILQESLLMGCYAYGTDIEARLVDYTRTNLNWLIEPAEHKLATGDATNYQWNTFDKLACETYLGRPFSTEPSPDKLREVIRDIDTIHKKFLKNLASQTKSGFRMCIAVPAWFTKYGIKHLPIIDQLPELGYTRMSFVHTSNKDMIYHREGQIVGRELLVLIRK